jgi:hypothetical protein
MHRAGSVRRTERRETRWCEPDEALALLTFESTRVLLRQALAPPRRRRPRPR